MASLHLRHRLIVISLQMLLLAPDGLSALYAAEPTGADSALHTALPPEKAAGEEGTAAYYAKRYHNSRTNSGERYNATRFTAAHPTLPHGTRVKIINLANDKEVIVTINDRCRKRKKPFIDVSRAAAKQLGFLGKGTARVRIIPLDAGES